MPKHKILMVDHDEDDRYTTQSFFTEKKYDVEVLYLKKSDEVINYLSLLISERRALPDLILLNIYLTPQNGIDVLAELKSNDRYKEIPVIMLGGSALPTAIKQCYALGAASVILKPFTEALTEKKIETFIKYWFEVVELPNKN